MTSMYQNHRQAVLEHLTRDGAAALFFSGSPSIRNNDCDFRFRPHSDFWYLTGFPEPESVLVLLPRLEGDDEDAVRGTVLFLRERDRDMEIWNGIRLGVEDAPERLGVDHAFPIDELWSQLPELLAGYSRIVYRTGIDEARDRSMTDTFEALRRKARIGISAPTELADPAPYVHEARLFKSDAELEVMARAAEITKEAHVSAMRETKPGARENEIDALLEYTFKRRGSTGPAYNNIVAGGANACILHYVENDQALADGDLLLIDAGAEVEFYASDVTRTFPVNGTFSAEQRAIYEIVLRAQLAAIDEVRPGKTFVAAHEKALDVICEGLIELGLLEGTLEEVKKDGSFRRFFMHKTGHWLGLDVHDCGLYTVGGGSRKLEPGMVTTVEPGIYIAPDDEEVEERWRGIGVRIEDDVVVTEAGHRILTDGIPKEIDEVEAACRG